MEVFAGGGPLGRHRAVSRGHMIPIEIRDGWVLLHAPKCLLVLSRQQFMEALKRGKAYCRRRVLEAPQPRPQEGRP